MMLQQTNVEEMSSIGGCRTVGVSWTNAPIGGRNDVHEFGELVHIFILALCGEHIVAQIVNAVPVSVIVVKENLQMAPVTLNGIGVRAGIGVNEAQAVINGQMGVTLLFKTAVGSPVISDQRNAGFDTCLYNLQQSFGSSIRNRIQKTTDRDLVPYHQSGGVTLN
jgi:hypothetical protein